ncbi:MAG TPA: hypothetical protein VL749_09865, partial [Patescibacteria group bacterium]|nr:hypothetical protein [Patescibacteria group bacterium]
MMNDRFSVELRQHLLETANERPADGQLATIVADVATTPQRRPLIARLPDLRGRIGPFPAAVRFGLIALALVLAAVVGAILAGGGATRPTTPFEGTWTTTDVPDGSTMNLYVGAGTSPSVRFEDLFATGDACIGDASKVFTADGAGEITGDRLVVSYPNGGGCGSVLVSIAGAYSYDRDTDTLRDQDGIVWTRIRSGDVRVPTVSPERSTSPSSGAVFEGRWTATDAPDGSTLTLIVGAGTAPVVQFQDDLATGAVCVADQVKVFRADGVGEITGNRLVVSYPDGGGCGLNLVSIGGRYDYEAGTDTLHDQDGVTWVRLRPGIDPAPTLRPAPSGRPAPTLAGGCVDLTHGGTYTASAGPVSVTATVPGSPVVSWYGSRDLFDLAASCVDGSPMGFHAMGATSVNDGSCMSSRADVTDFADAIA